MKNNKGFAISSIMYLILIMAIIIVTLILSILFSRNLILENQKNKLIDDIELAQVESMYVENFYESSSLQLFKVPRTGYYKIEMCANGTESKGDCTSGIVILKNDTKLYFDINSTSSSLRINNNTSNNNNIIMKVDGSSSYISGYIGDDSTDYSSTYVFSNPEKTVDANSSNGYAKVTYISPISQLYNYTGGEEEFTAPVSGYYKLEVWGAEGDSENYGGYSRGVVYLNKNQIIYIKSGKKNTTGESTYISLDTLSTLSSYNSDVLIVGGGGGNSGYIGNSSLINKVMYCYNCTETSDTISTTEVSETPTSNTVKIGDGAAKITFVGDDYLELEYIKSTGTQYIDLNYIPTTTTTVEMYIKFDGTFLPSDNHGAFFGSYDSNANAYSINFGGSAGQDYNIYNWVDTSYDSGASIYDLIVDSNTISTKNKLLFESGKMTYGSYSKDLPTKTQNQTLSMYIFGDNVNGAPHPFGSYNMYLYELKIYENGKLVRWYIPSFKALDKSVGLYELIQEKFYENKGDGAFIYN